MSSEFCPRVMWLQLFRHKHDPVSGCGLMIESWEAMAALSANEFCERISCEALSVVG